MNALASAADPKAHLRMSPGRPRGSRNLVNLELLDMLQAEMKKRYGIDRYDPVIALAEIACDVSNPLDIRATAHAKIAPFVRPQLKQVEVTGADGGPIEVKSSVIDQLLMAVLENGDLAKVVEGVATTIIEAPPK